MAKTGGKPRASLQKGLDNEIYQVVDKYLEEFPQSIATLRASQVWDWIQKSKSSLKRKPRSILEGSIDRVLAVMVEEFGEEDDDDMEPLEGDFGDLNPQPKPSKTVNNLITASWSASPARTTPAASTNGEKKTKRRDGDRKTNDEPPKKKHKSSEADKGANIDISPPTHLSLQDIGGVEDIKRELKQHLVLPLLCPEEYAARNLPIPRGILLHGPPGCGKTAISRAFAAKLGVPFIEILGPSVVSGMSGESERQVREHFEKAKEVAPCLIFIDEIDVIAPKRDTAQSQMEKRIVAQLLISMDSLAMEGNDGKPVIVLAATNRPDAIDPALRRGGRFDSEINMGVPNETARGQILRALMRNVRSAPDVSYEILAKKTSGFVGADLRDLVGKAGTWSMDRYREALEAQAAATEADDMEVDTVKAISEVDRSIERLIRRCLDKDAIRPPGFEDTSVTMEAFDAVFPGIQPSSKREGFTTRPDANWDDVGSLDDVREELNMAIVEPILNAQRYKNVGISAPTGVLLWGPPGCGKTLLAKAVANASEAAFISVKGPELLNKFVGESERAVRQVFMRARSSRPCVVFFDELDALVPRRNDALSEASARVVNTLLTELDGLSEREGIYVIGATNRPDIIDDAMLRPGRLETLLFVGLPKKQDRVAILKALIKKTPISPLLAEFASDDRCNNFSGADLSSLLRKAGQATLKRGADKVELQDFERAVGNVRASVGDPNHYERLKKKFATQI